MKSVFLFPGQGGKNKDMIKNLYKNFQIIKNTINYGSRILKYDIWRIIQNKQKINKTIYLQPIIIVINTAIWRLWNQNKGKKPNILVGHSLGEYSALVCDSKISFKNIIILTQKRAYLMRYLPKKKLSMISVLGLNCANFKEIFFKIRKKYLIEVSNYNTKKNIVISLYKKNIKQIKTIFSKYHIKNIIMKTDFASHCKMIFNISKKFGYLLKNIKWFNKKTLIIHNININYNKNIYNTSDILVRHLYSPVRWLETIKYLEFLGVKYFIECGANKMLTKMLKRMTGIECKNINTYETFKKNLQKKKKI